MKPDHTEGPEMFSSQWYDEYFRRAVSSPAHAAFCELVYGRDLCQHGLMDIAELDFLVSLIEPGSKVLEVGCSNGYITEYIYDRTGAEILGLDYSEVAIDQARGRTRDKGESLQFQRVDLTTEPIPGGDYDLILMIDSIYFLGDFKETVQKMSQVLGPDGVMVITTFDVKDEDVEGSQLPGPETTLLAKAFLELGLPYHWHDFTANVRSHGIKNYQAGEKLRAAFESEGNHFLYQARAAENRFFKEMAEKEAITRFMYVVSPFLRT